MKESCLPHLAHTHHACGAHWRFRYDDDDCCYMSLPIRQYSKMLEGMRQCGASVLGSSLFIDFCLLSLSLSLGFACVKHTWIDRKKRILCNVHSCQSAGVNQRLSLHRHGPLCVYLDLDHSFDATCRFFRRRVAVHKFEIKRSFSVQKVRYCQARAGKFPGFAELRNSKNQKCL